MRVSGGHSFLLCLSLAKHQGCVKGLCEGVAAGIAEGSPAAAAACGGEIVFVLVLDGTLGMRVGGAAA
jgi:hypothetical protein